MQRRYIDISDVHRHLSDAVFVDIPSDSLRTLQRAGLHDRRAVGVAELLAGDGVAFAHGATLLAHVERDGVGAACRRSVEIEVDGDEEVACSYDGAASASHLLVERTSAEVGRLSVVVDTLGDALVFALAAHGEVSAFGCERRSLVAIARNVEFVGDALGELARNLCALLKRDAAHRNNRQYVGSADTRMRTVMLTHIYKLSGFAHCSESSLHDVVGFANEGYDCAVGCFARVYVEQLNALNALHCVSDLTNNVQVAAFAEVRHTLYNLLCFCHSVRYYVSSKFVSMQKYQRYGCKYSKNGSLEQVKRHEKTKQTQIKAQKKGLADTV